MNLPNKLTMLRIFLIPVFLFFYLSSFVPGHYVIALVIFIAASLTDMLDGKIARKYHTTVSRLLKLNGMKRSSVLRVGRMIRCS